MMSESEPRVETNPGPSMATASRAETKVEVRERIFKSLEEEDVKRVELGGEAGTGKTWVANEVCKLATGKGSCYIALWLHLNKKFDERSLYEDIAAQLCLFGEYEETEDGDWTKKDDGIDEDLDRLKADIKKTLTGKKKQAEEDKKSPLSEGGKKTAKGEKNLSEGDNKSAPPPRNKYLLLILNDEGSVTEEEDVMKDLKLGEFLKDYGPIKTLVTRRKVNDSSTNQRGEAEPVTENNSGENEAGENDPTEIQAAAAEDSTRNAEPVSEPVAKDETKALLDSLNEDTMGTLLDTLTDKKGQVLLDQTLGKESLKSTIVKRSLRLPAAVVVLAKSLNCIASNLPDSERNEYVKKVFKEVVPTESPDSESATKQRNYVLHLGYELLKSIDGSKDRDRATFDCFWHSLDFFEHCGGVYYRDLIMHWILEGYFDPVRSVEKAYQTGHSVLMDFVNRGILKIQENNVVVPEVAMNHLIDLRYRGFFGTSRLAFSRVYGGDKAKGLGRITVVDDMVKTVQKDKKNDKLSTILVSGDRLRRETPKKFFENKEMENLEVLGLFNPALESLVGSLKKLNKLRFLVIRDYDLLNSIDELRCLKSLQVLEVSGASSLENIPDDFFAGMDELQSLNLSGLRIKSSPSSISKLKKLRCLILRDCPELEDLPEIHDLKELEVIDLRGARELKTCFDHEKAKDKEKGEDRDKDKVPGKDKGKGGDRDKDKVQGKDRRQVKEKGEGGDKSKERKKNKSKNKNFYHLTQLQLLDLSESQVERLPIFQDSAYAEQLSSLTHLLLRDCRNLRRLPSLKPLSGLQVLDLSGTSSLIQMLEVCFEDKNELRILDLSGTNLSELPSTFSELSNLTHLLLKDCPNLKALPNIEKLTRLEVFDASGSTKLVEIEGSFKGMSYLRELNLCGTGVRTIRDLPEPSSLRCSKYIVLHDSRREDGESWEDIKQKLPSGTFESASSSDAAAETIEISEQETGQGETPLNVPNSSVCPEKKLRRKELVYHDSKYEDLLQNNRQFVPESPSVIEKIPSCSDPSELSDDDRERISNAEFVSFVDNCSPSVSSFQMTSLKGCWVNRCKKMENLFSGEQEKHVESLETLWVSNLPLLKSLCSGSPEHGGFKNLRKLSIDSCPNIETLFPAPQLPTSLEEMHIKFCDKLQKLFGQGGDLPNLKVLCLLELPALTSVGARLPELETFTKTRCPKLVAEKGDLKDWVMVEHNETA